MLFLLGTKHLRVYSELLKNIISLTQNLILSYLTREYYNYYNYCYFILY